MNFSFNNLKVGSLVEMEILDNRQNMIKLKTIVEDLTSESVLKLFSPVFQGKPYPLRIGEGFNLITVYKYPTVDKYDIFSCRCKVIDRERDGNISTVTIQKNGSFKAIQRRNYFRLPLIKNMKLNYDGDEIDMLSKDLSANGIRGYINKKIPASSEITLMLDVDEKILELKTKVIECNPDPDHTYRYELRGSFVNIKNSQISLLLKYIFAKQSEAIRKQVEMDDYVSILDTDQHYSDFFSMSNLEKIIRISPILTWVITLISYSYLMNAFRDNNKGINFFFGEFTRSFKPEYLMTANQVAWILLFCIGIGFSMNNLFNKKPKNVINIQYLIQLMLALGVIVTYQVVI
ncbi:flagellar brake protein [Acidaminobacter sp. JC074]|uniref:flagellar brake protein n=1 Tax=Acidaminobacter sp. JC074 TaxID=2530199 RepID=UPI001F0DA916|nr:PilZ domain-containing protein [Acidaminobacter sp. JC074]MCH4890756.1 flagellar brake protein [Acidaminobacter sp. JC074]